MFAFIDESSFPRPSEDSEFSVLLAACIKSENIRGITQRVYQLKTKLFGGGTDVSWPGTNY